MVHQEDVQVVLAVVRVGQRAALRLRVAVESELKVLDPPVGQLQVRPHGDRLRLSDLKFLLQNRYERAWKVLINIFLCLGEISWTQVLALFKVLRSDF